MPVVNKISSGNSLSAGRIACSLLALILLGVLVLVLNRVEPFHRGFFCQDDTIVYPFKPSTIKSWVLFVVGAFVPFILILAHSWYLSRRPDWCEPSSIIRLKERELRLKPFHLHYLRFIFIFALGGAINQAVTDVGKVTVGRLRPNFISVCHPNYTQINCTTANNIPRFVTEDVCTNPDKAMVKDSRKSWPSGHSSTSVYTMLFAVLYLEHCLVFRRMHGVRQFVNLALLLLAFATCLSRIDDNKHHWSDVLSGSIIGASVALLVFWLSFPAERRSAYLPPDRQSEVEANGMALELQQLDMN